jgi:hypothetical protein
VEGQWRDSGGTRKLSASNDNEEHRDVIIEIVLDNFGRLHGCKLRS